MNIQIIFLVLLTRMAIKSELRDCPTNMASRNQNQINRASH
jgi:hypothetical protein